TARFCSADWHTTEVSSLSLHDALPISLKVRRRDIDQRLLPLAGKGGADGAEPQHGTCRPFAHLGIVLEHMIAELSDDRTGIAQRDRKSTRLNSSHVKISYAVFCLKKKK